MAWVRSTSNKECAYIYSSVCKDKQGRRLAILHFDIDYKTHKGKKIAPWNENYSISIPEKFLVGALKRFNYAQQGIKYQGVKVEEVYVTMNDLRTFKWPKRLFTPDDMKIHEFTKEWVRENVGIELDFLFAIESEWTGVPDKATAETLERYARAFYHHKAFEEHRRRLYFVIKEKTKEGVLKERRDVSALIKVSYKSDAVFMYKTTFSYIMRCFEKNKIRPKKSELLKVKN